jgi:hypothetical protein
MKFIEKNKLLFSKKVVESSITLPYSNNNIQYNSLIQTNLEDIQNLKQHLQLNRIHRPHPISTSIHILHLINK